MAKAKNRQAGLLVEQFLAQRFIEKNKNPKLHYHMPGSTKKAPSVNPRRVGKRRPWWAGLKLEGIL